MAAGSIKLGLRYARALLRAVERTQGTVSQGTNGTAATPAQKNAAMLTRFVETLKNTPHFEDSLVNPMFSREEREKALMSALKLFGPDETLASFIRVCFERDRIAIIEDVAAAFTHLADEAAGVVEVEVMTARDVDLFERSKVEMMVKEKVSGTPKFLWVTNPEILGGMIIKIGDRVVDSSVSSRLEQYKAQLVKAAAA